MNVKTAAVLAGVAGIAAGIAIGFGVAAARYDKDEMPAKTRSAAKAVAKKSGKPSGSALEAVITAMPEKNVLHVRTHTWVGQFAMASVCLRGEVAEPKPCHYEADVENAGVLKTGQPVSLISLTRVQGAIAPHQIVPVIPEVSVPSDKIKGPVLAQNLRLIDGDTTHVLAETFPDHYIFTAVRVGGIDTPEKHFNTKKPKAGEERKGAQCPEEAELSKRATASAESLIGGKHIFISGLEFEKYGARVLGSISTLDGTDLAQYQIKQGFAKPYDGHAKSSWCGLPVRKK